MPASPAGALRMEAARREATITTHHSGKAMQRGIVSAAGVSHPAGCSGTHRLTTYGERYGACRSGSYPNSINAERQNCAGDLPEISSTDDQHGSL